MLSGKAEFGLALIFKETGHQLNVTKVTYRWGGRAASSRFLTALSARFGMTGLCLLQPGSERQGLRLLSLLSKRFWETPRGCFAYQQVGAIGRAYVL
jgi:hypothetical protein